jgi:hypothetical protein
MRDKPLVSWMTSSPGAFLSIRAGRAVRRNRLRQHDPGRAENPAGRIDLERQGRHAVGQCLVDDYDDARTLAHTWADLLTDGQATPD